MARIRLGILISVLAMASLIIIPGANAASDAGVGAGVTVLAPDRITVTPDSANVTTGTTTFQFTATAYYSSTNVTVTSYADWASSNISVATIGPHTGQATILKVGSTTISATFNGKKGNAILKVSAGTSPPTGGGGGVGGGGGSSPSGTTILAEYINDEGRLLSDATAESADGEVELYLPQGITAKQSNGRPLHSIYINENTAPPDPPADSKFVCLVYDIGPIGTTFNPPAYLRFKYSDSDIPPGVTEENMVLATWQDGKWVELRGTVDTVNNVITVPISHLSTFTVITHTSPAIFEVNGMNVTPAEVYPNKTVTVSVKVANTGDLAGSIEIILKINDAVKQTQTVSVSGGRSQTVSFSVVSGPAGNYIVEVNGLTSKFTVKPVAPEGTVAEVPAPQPSPESTPTPTPASTEEPTPTTAPTATIETPAATEPTETLIGSLPMQLTDNRIRIITGSIGGFLIVAALVTLLIRRRRF